MSENNYINKLVQKGFAKWIPGCLEHSSMLQESLSDAFSAKNNICITFLALCHAFGSIPHELIKKACEWFHFPSEFNNTNDKIAKFHINSTLVTISLWV